MVPVPWQAVEPQQGRFHWEQLDRWVVWAKSTKRAIMIGPLLDLRPGGIPGWVLPSLKDLPKFEQHLYRFVREVVIRYAPVDPTWHVAAGVNSNEVAALTGAEMTQLVRQAVVAVRQVVPEARILVEAADPFGERSSADNGAIGAVPFVRLLISEGVKLSSVGIPVVIGDAATGTRDLMRIADMLDRFASRKEMPVLVVSALDAPSAPHEEPGAGYWHKPWAEDVQAAWAQMAFQLAISQRNVALVFWDRLRDDAGTGLRDGGIFGSGGTPKQAARSLLLARRRIRQPLGAKDTGQP
jgi:GH35 family endo-1,4-beta-xylanase